MTEVPTAQRLRRSGLTCEARVRQPATETREWRRRVFEAERRFLDPRICGAVARFRVGTLVLCQSHAGRAALAELLGERFQ